MASTIAGFQNFLKDNYTSETIEDLTKKNRPLYGRVARDEDQGGKRYIHPFISQNPQGTSNTLANAQTVSSQSGGGGNIGGYDWVCTWGDYAGSVSIGDKVIKASRSNSTSFLRDRTIEIDGLYNKFGDVMSTYMYSDGGMSLGSGTISSGVVTLTNFDDIVNIQIGQVLQVSANSGASPTDQLIAGAGNGYVIAVNPNAGQFTVSTTSGGSAGTPTNWSGTMFFFQLGDFGGNSGNRILLGLNAWIPGSDPSSTTFEGLNRTIDVVKMSGVRLTATEIQGLTLEQRLKRLVTRMVGRNFGPGPTDIYLNPEKWQSLADSLESRGRRDIGGTAEFGYEFIKLAAGGKTVQVFPDPFCPIGTAFALHLPSIKVASVGKFPEVVNEDGLELLRNATTNDFEYRIVGYPAFVVSAPGFCGRVSTL